MLKSVTTNPSFPKNLNFLMNDGFTDCHNKLWNIAQLHLQNWCALFLLDIVYV